MSQLREQSNLSNFYHVINSSKIRFTGNTGANLFFTWNLPNRAFGPVNFGYVLVDRGPTYAFTASPTIRVGTNASTYDNWISTATSLTFGNTTSTINTIGQHNYLTLLSNGGTGIPLMTNGQSCYINIIGGGSLTGGFYDVIFVIEGFSVPV